MPGLKIFCTACKDFTDHDTRKIVWCERCRGKGHPGLIAAIIVVTIAAFIVAVARIAMGGSW